MKDIEGPFLIIAPLSTIPNWEREFRTWTDLNVVVYHGSQASRKTIQAYEMYYRDAQVKNNGIPLLNSLYTESFTLTVWHVRVMQKCGTLSANLNTSSVRGTLELSEDGGVSFAS